MAAAINIPDSLKEKFADLLVQSSIDLKIVLDGSGRVQVIEGADSDRREGTRSTLYTHGWINCEVARRVAEDLSISYSEAGRIMDFLNIKVRNCELGCF
jgi:hypothetical protein